MDMSMDIYMDRASDIRMDMPRRYGKVDRHVPKGTERCMDMYRQVYRKVYGKECGKVYCKV